MGMFDLTATAGVKEAGNVLSAGIHNAKFNGVKLNSITSQNTGQTYTTMQVLFDVENYGEFSHNFFEPTNNERTQSQFGENPSQVEHFMVAIRQILDALDPEIGKKIDVDDLHVKDKNGNDKKVNIKNLDFTQLVNLVDYLTKPYIGVDVEIKLVPQNNGFNDLPGFPARISKTGALGIATRFIGTNLVLNQSEQKKIDAAKNATPTNMQQKSSADVTELADSLGIDLNDTKDDGDLPF